MNKADFYYKQNLTKILEEGTWDENPRPKYKDGTPAYSKFITGVFEEYDISKGEFPITTLRNTAVKTGISEILTIFQNQENTRESFEANGVFWWESWMNESGNIGRSYPYNIESHRPNEMKRSVVKIKPRIVDTKFKNLKDIDKLSIGKSIDDKIYNSKYRNYGDYIIVDKIYKDKKCYIECQYLNTGYKTLIREDMHKKGQSPKNNYIRTNCEIGYLDYTDDLKFTKQEKKALHKIWTRMLKRCYFKEQNKSYENIFVHQNWHSFRNFLLDIRYLPQYFLAKENKFKNWELDKDYYGSNCYSKDTCVFLNKKENTTYRSTQIPLIKITDTKNNSYSYELSYSELSRTLGLSRGYTKHLVYKGFYKDLKFELISDNEYLYRYELSRNQLNILLKSLKKDPYSRRHIISFWNWANIDKKELVECAYETKWSVRKVDNEYYLDMTLTQRSNDYLTAGYINKIQYVALMMMVANHVGYKVGVFRHLVQNLHIYDRHIEMAEELLNRTPLDLNPYITLESKKDFYEYTIDDFEIFNIKGIHKLPQALELAI